MLIVGIIIGGLEIAYLIGFFGFKFAQNEKLNDIFTSIWALSTVLLIVAACCSMLAGALYSVLLYNSDIRKKSGYMLFLTPTPTWQWILAKILMGLLATAVLVVVFAVLGIADILLFIPELDDTSFIGQLLIPLRDMFFDNIGTMVLFLLNMILQIVVMITTIWQFPCPKPYWATRKSVHLLHSFSGLRWKFYSLPSAVCLHCYPMGCSPSALT